LDKNCKLEDPESVRQFIAKRHVSSGRKENMCDVYSKYSKSLGIAFEKPRYSREDSLPFIPLEKEVLAVIDASRNLRHAVMLRLLYETGMRVGEASRLQFKDFDFEKRAVRVIPEKGSRARELRLSEKLCSMLKSVFGKYPKSPFPTGEAARHYLDTTRRVLAERENNPRYLNIHLHTLRHFKATMMYAQTKDILYVQKILGHRWIQNTLRYTQLVDLKESDDFVCKVARTLGEASALIEKGFDYVTELDGVKLFKKRK
jgi:integrase